MAPAGIVSLNSSGSRSRSSTVISMAIEFSGSKAVIDSDVWFQSRSQLFGIDRKLVKIRRFVFQAAKPAPHSQARKDRVVQAEVKGELRHQLRGQTLGRRGVQID